MKFLIFVVFALFGQRLPAAETGGINFYIENDTRYLGGPGSDSAYSSGLKLSYVSADDQVPDWAQMSVYNLQALREIFEKYKSNFSISLAQQIYTPNDVSKTALIVNDRPYAGWTYVGFGAVFKEKNKSYAAELDIGLIGPESGAEQMQNNLHRIIGTSPLRGWDNQLKSELTLQLSFQQKQKYFELSNSEDKNYFDIIPYFGGALGNVSLAAYTGAILRLGRHLPDDFGPGRVNNSEGETFIEPNKKISETFSYYGFTGGRVILVGRNIFLDGNTFQASHRVTKKLVVLEGDLGAVVEFSRWSLAWHFVIRSAEFAESDNVNGFAAVSLSHTLK